MEIIVKLKSLPISDLIDKLRSPDYSQYLPEICLSYQLPFTLLKGKSNSELAIYLGYVIKYSPTPIHNYGEYLPNTNVIKFMLLVPNYMDLFPRFTYPINGKAAELWVHSQCYFYLQHVAQFLIQHTYHITFNEFYNSLTSCLSEFMLNIQQPYILLTLYRNDVKSTYWLAQLSFPLLHPKPIDVLPFAFDALKLYSIRDFLIVDDAIYSASQMLTTISSIVANIYQIGTDKGTTHVYTIHIVIPYYSEYGMKRLDTFINALETNIKIRIYSRKVLNSLDYFLRRELSPVEAEKFREAVEFGWGYSSGNIPAYFDHKMPDRLSSYPTIYSGETSSQTWKNTGYKFVDKKAEYNPEYPNALDRCSTGNSEIIPYIENCPISKEPCPMPFYKKLLNKLISGDSSQW